jgi:phosphomannomutase/phosphoglucomutase
MAPTPALQFAIRNHAFAGGVIVTASHNPPQYNGIKVIWRDGIEISHEQEDQIENIHFNNKSVLAEWDKVGKRVAIHGVIDEYIQDIQRHINPGKISKKNFHVVVDAVNSVGGLTACRF